MPTPFLAGNAGGGIYLPFGNYTLIMMYAVYPLLWGGKVFENPWS